MKDIIERAIKLLDNKFNLPDKGFLAGGALCNTINKIIFGGNVVINDIDIFILDEIKNIDKIDDSDTYNNKSLRAYIKKEEEFEVLEYNNLTTYINRKRIGINFNIIKTSNRKDIFNFINYDSSSDDYNFLLETFDINCCQVGYDLENKIAFWTKDFSEYCKTKELKVSLPNTPSHTALRILKKRDELGAILNIDNEFNFLKNANLQYIYGLKRYWFSDKYFEIYQKYEREISKYFTLHTNKKETYTSYRLYPINWERYPHVNGCVDMSCVVKTDFTNSLKCYMSIEQYAYYWRNIKTNKYKNLIWERLQSFYKTDDYLDGIIIDDIDVDFYHKIVDFEQYLKKYPFMNKSFKDISLIKQLEILGWFKKLISKDSDIENLLSINTKSFNIESEEELEDNCMILKLYYRKNLNKKVEDNKNLDLFDIF
jgi:hypothetical protein